MSQDYKQTVFLPQTTFSLQGVESEADIIRQWDASEVNAYWNISSVIGTKFVLHDGPPYANGDIHMGHAMNKILKDIVVRSQYALGSKVKYRPGWDCHGLPIEAQVEKNLMAEGRNKRDLTVSEFRQLCRDYAQGWVDKQREQFKSLGVTGDWNNPYLTMDYATEAKIVAQLHKFLMSNMLYRANKPVLWSTVEETALAEAEVVYKDLKVSSVYVAYPFSQVNNDGWMDRTSILIWTTTPWTLPGSYAIAFNPNISYGIYEVDGVIPGKAKCRIGDRFIVADKLVQKAMNDIGVTAYRRVEDAQPQYYTTGHPLRSEQWGGYKWGVPCLPGDHVTDDAGTGFVHTSPDHGPEDFAVWKKNGMGDYHSHVKSDGTLDCSLFDGLNILGQTPKGDYIFEFTNAKVLAKLEEAGTLMATQKVTISYPHSWRSGAPLIYRATPQWFLSLEKYGTREAALKEIDETQFVPEMARNRLRAAVETRPDWLISRQRVWGTPLAIFVNKETGEPLKDDRLNSTIQGVFSRFGGDAWWEGNPDSWLRSAGHDPKKYEMVTDVLDVWFDSGCSHLFLEYLDLEENEKADLYLEGSDQHRGWFGSSLLVSVADHDVAPFKRVLTHGFVLDAKGEKMSKSKGNVVDPLAEAQKYGTDVIRLWVAMSDYTQDIKVGPKILDTARDAYRKLRNTLRYLCAAIHDFDDPDVRLATELGVDHPQGMPPLERYVLHQLGLLEREVKFAYSEFRFGDVVRLLLDFSNDLSSFYFDLRKDTLYCDRWDNPVRIATRVTLFDLHFALTALMSPILPFTTEEAWAAGGGVTGGNATRRWDFITSGEVSEGDVEAARWEKIRAQARVVQAALETERKAGRLKQSLDAYVMVYLTKASDAAVWGDRPCPIYSTGIDDGKNPDPAVVFRTSQAAIHHAKVPSEAFTLPDVPGVGVLVYLARGEKCERSRRYFEDVGSDPRHPTLSARDADAVEYWKNHQ